MCVRHRIYVGYYHGFALGLPMCVQIWLYVGYPYVGLHRFDHLTPHRLYVDYPYVRLFGFAHVCPTWALCELTIYGFALGVPMCVKYGLYVGYHMWV